MLLGKHSTSKSINCQKFKIWLELGFLEFQIEYCGLQEKITMPYILRAKVNGEQEGIWVNDFHIKNFDFQPSAGEESEIKVERNKKNTRQ